MAVINESGASVTSLQEYKTLIEDLYLAIDENWNIEPESPDGQAISIWSERLADLDEKLVYVFQSLDPRTAVGAALHRIGAISGTAPLGATASTNTVVFSGIESTVIPVGTEVINSATDTVWETDTEVSISGGVAEVGVTCQTLGAEPADVGDLSVIGSSIGGVTDVTNAEAASLGSESEADSLFRVRRNLSVAKPSTNQVDKIFSEIANLEGVKKVKVVENYEAAADANGVEGHSLVIFVDGGSTSEIAATIAATKSPGCGLNSQNTFSNKVQLATATPSGNPFTATFYRPSLSTIYVYVAITGVADEDDVKQAIIDYANASLFDTEGLGFDKTGFNIGDVISAGKLHTPVNSVVGDTGYVTSILIGEDEYTVTENTIDVGFNGLGVFDENNIEVIVTP